MDAARGLVTSPKGEMLSGMRSAAARDTRGRVNKQLAICGQSAMQESKWPLGGTSGEAEEGGSGVWGPAPWRPGRGVTAS